MRSDGRVLPDLAETAVLHRLGLVRTDDLPGIAARWLATDLVDTEAARMLAGHDPHDTWVLDELLADSVSQAHVTVPSTSAAAARNALDWVSMRWRETQDTRWAVVTLAHLGETDPELGLGLFIGLDDEWIGGWGRSVSELKAEADKEFVHILHDNGGPSVEGTHRSAADR